jgi:hypothetical protein
MTGLSTTEALVASGVDLRGHPRRRGSNRRSKGAAPPLVHLGGDDADLAEGVVVAVAGAVAFALNGAAEVTAFCGEMTSVLSV